MAKLIIVVGLPGSGKSYYLQQLMDTHEISGYYDDYQKGSYDKSLNPYLSKNYGKLLASLMKGEVIAITDIVYCQSDRLDATIESIRHVLPHVQIDVRYFENNPGKAIRNIRRRGRDRRIEHEITFVNNNSPLYKPDKLNVMPIYSKS